MYSKTSYSSNKYTEKQKKIVKKLYQFNKTLHAINKFLFRKNFQHSHSDAIPDFLEFKGVWKNKAKNRPI